MKLRLRGNSLRLRLSQGEVESLVKAGLLEETLDLVPNPLIYMVHSSRECKDIQVSFMNGWLTIAVPESALKNWAGSAAIGMEATHRGVAVLIEKDFACEHRNPPENEDTFERPKVKLAGQ
jgi:hypothetical protein